MTRPCGTQKEHTLVARKLHLEKEISSPCDRRRSIAAGSLVGGAVARGRRLVRHGVAAGHGVGGTQRESQRVQKLLYLKN